MVIQSCKSTDKCILQMRKIIFIFKILSQIQDILYTVTEVTPGTNAPLILFLLWCNFPWYKNAVTNPKQCKVEDILPDKSSAEEATQSSCPPQNCSFQHSKESPHGWKDNSQSETWLLWLCSGFLLCCWFMCFLLFRFCFKSVCVLFRNIYIIM